MLPNSKSFAAKILAASAAVFPFFANAQLSPSQAVKTLERVYDGSNGADLNQRQNWGGNGAAGMYMFISHKAANAPEPVADNENWFHVIEMQHQEDNAWMGQIGMDYYNDGGLYWRHQDSWNWRPWKKVASEDWVNEQVWRTRNRTNAGLQGNNGATSGFFETAAPVNFPTNASSWWHLLDVRHSNTANNYAMQFSGSFFDQNL
jgi:hypothetical protein